MISNIEGHINIQENITILNSCGEIFLSCLFLCQYPAAIRRTISSIYSKTNDGLNRQMSTLKLFCISKCIQHPVRVVPLGGRVKY